jgi:hypothetical protein
MTSRSADGVLASNIVNGRADVNELIKSRSGINFDIGCGASKSPGWVGMDFQALPGVDIVHDWSVFPWPLPDECANTIKAYHVIEHVNPANFGFINWMNEVWRIAKPGAEFHVIFPHGSSQGYLQDPTHCNACNEATWIYFTPMHPYYNFYTPKPWRIKLDGNGEPMLYWSPAANVEVLLVKMTEEEADEFRN